MRYKRAFTLIEVIIAVAIIGVLTALLIFALPRIIETANEKSALSDANNTFKELRAKQFENVDIGNSIIIVEKANKTYLYGYFAGSDELMIAASNPYNDNTTIDALKEQNAIICDEEYSKIDTSLKSTTVYTGCKLTDFNFDILLDAAQIGLVVDEITTLNYEIINGTKSNYQELVNDQQLIWTSDNTDVCTVANGEVKAISIGEAVVTVKCGTVKKSCRVIVNEYSDFNGNFADLKIELESDTSSSYIRLTDDIYLTDYPDIFPIVLPYGKVVRMDMNGHNIEYASTNEDCNIYSVFINNGGSFYVNNLNRNDFDLIGGIITVTNHYVTPIPEEPSLDYTSSYENYLIENTNGGYLVLCHDIVLNCYYQSYCVKNTNGFLFVNGGCIYSYHMGVYNGKNSRYLHEFDQSINSIRDKSTVDGIDNYGIMSMNGGDILATRCIGVTIRNYGLIKTISGGTLRTNFSTPVIVNKTGGTIQSITGGVFGYKPEYGLEPIYTKDFCSILCEENSNIINISGGEFYANGRDIFEGVVPGRIVSGGKFFLKLSDKYLADGYKIDYDEAIRLYVVHEK